MVERPLGSGVIIDEDGYIVEKATNSRVIANDAQEIKASQFGGIKKGSEIYIKC